MNTNESSDLGTESNNPTNTSKESAPLELDQIASIVSKSFLGGEENSGLTEPEENSEQDVQATSEDGNVHSQETEVESEQEELTESEETEETNSEDQLERGLPKGVKKRIDKLSSKKREAEAEVERLRSEVERLSQEVVKPAQTPTKDNPYANLSTIEDISKEVEQAKQIRRWCEMNPDGAVVTDNNGNTIEYSAEEVRNIKIKSMDALEEHLPARTRYLQNFQQIDVIANKEYPWWKDKSAKERQTAETFLKAFPEIQKFPDYKMVIGDYIAGVKARESKVKNSGVINKAPSQPRPSSAPAPVSQKDAKFSNAKNRFSKSGSRDDLSTIIANRFL